jgi:hypothetical protein
VTPTQTIYGQAAIFTALVSSRSGRPTGKVVFKEGSTTLGSVDIGSNRIATLSIATLGVGNHSIIAYYQGNGRFAPSASAAQVQPVSPAHDTILLESSPPTSTPVSPGQQVTLTANVVGVTIGAGKPTGTVQFLDNGRPLGAPVPLDATGDATFSTSFGGMGTQTLTAKYLGDGHFQGAISTPLSLVVSGSRKAPSVTVLTSPATLAPGRPLTLTARVSAGRPGLSPPTGEVQFMVDGRNVDGPSALGPGGKVTVTFTGLQVGGHTVTAVYLGNGRYATSSQTLPLQVNSSTRGSSETSLTASGGTVGVGGQVTMTAQVKAPSATAVFPSGQVQFLVDGKAQGQPVALDVSGKALLTLTFARPGGHRVTVRYLGDANYYPSSSSAMTIQVHAGHQAASVTTLTSSVATAAAGQKVVLTARVVAGSGGTGRPTGKVQFLVNGNALGQPVQLDSRGMAVLAITTLPPGTDHITVRYLGNGNFSPSNSREQVVKVSRPQAQDAVVVSSSGNPGTVGHSVTFTAQVTAPVTRAHPLTGKVQFLVDGTPVGRPVALDAHGKAVWTISWNQAGTHKITARYLGNSFFSAVTSPVFVEKVAVVTDPNLARLIAAWPTLPESIRQAILALLDSRR